MTPAQPWLPVNESVICGMDQNTGKYIIGMGAVVVVVGVLVYFFHDRLHWFGWLPGDIRVERDNFRFYFPITTMVVISVLVSLVVWIARRFL